MRAPAVPDDCVITLSVRPLNMSTFTRLQGQTDYKSVYSEHARTNWQVKRRAEQAPINLDGAEVERVKSFKFIGVHITNKLSWSKHTNSLAWVPRQFGMSPQILKMLYSCTIESILTGCISAWYGNSSASERKALQRVVSMAQYITGDKLPDIQDLYTRRWQRKAQKIVGDSSHPSHRLFSLLPHGTRAPSLGPKVFLTASTPRP